MKCWCFFLPDCLAQYFCYTCQPFQIQVIRVYGHNFNWLLCPVLLCFPLQLRWVFLFCALKGSKEEEMHFIKPKETLVSYGNGTHKLECCVLLPEQISITWTICCEISCFMLFRVFSLKVGVGEDCHDNSGYSFYYKYLVNLLVITFMEQSSPELCHQVWTCI